MSVLTNKVERKIYYNVFFSLVIRCELEPRDLNLKSECGVYFTIIFKY